MKNLNKKRVLILGGTGFVGRHATALFKKYSAHVTSLGSADSYNLQDEAARHDVIINLAAIVNAHELVPSKETEQVNIHLSRDILEAVRQKNPRAKVIFASSQTVYGATEAPIITEDHPINPQTIYAKQKYEAEEIYREYKMIHKIDSVVLRFANIYGPGADPKKSVISLFAKLAKEDGTISVFGEGKELRDYLYVEDAAEALASAAAKKLPDLFYNCGSNEYHCLSEIAAHIVKHVGKGRIEYKPFPKDYARYPGNLILNSDKFMKASGWKPRYSFEEGVRSLLA